MPLTVSTLDGGDRLLTLQSGPTIQRGGINFPPSFFVHLCFRTRGKIDAQPRRAPELSPSWAVLRVTPFWRVLRVVHKRSTELDRTIDLCTNYRPTSIERARQSFLDRCAAICVARRGVSGSLGASLAPERAQDRGAPARGPLPALYQPNLVGMFVNALTVRGFEVGGFAQEWHLTTG